MSLKRNQRKELLSSSLSECEKNEGSPLVFFDQQYRLEGYRNIAGVDEAGRGPLAGPVVAGAVIAPSDFFLPGLNDSKKLTPKKRDRLYEELIRSPDLFCGVGVADAELIDEINILQATIVAMKRAIQNLGALPDLLLIDGLSFEWSVRSEKVIKGDAKSFSIAAGSVVAKVTRDRMMEEWDAIYPEYGFAGHKGYGTKKHLSAIEQYGPCEIHRRSFEPIKSMVCVS